MIKAITFDFWDTLVKDDSDEPKRAARGLASKPIARLQCLTTEITTHHPHFSSEQIKQAFDHANERFNHYWKVECITPSVASRLDVLYNFLGIKRTPGFDEAVRHIEEMEVNIPPDFAPDIHDILTDLAKNYKLGIISDTIHTPGRGLRQLLAQQGLLKHFDYCVFSDEVGAAKPAPLVFEKAAKGLGVSLDEIVHIGDRESNDVAGPLAMDMQTILYTGFIDRGSNNTKAHAVCQNYKQLPKILKNL